MTLDDHHARRHRRQARTARPPPNISAIGRVACASGRSRPVYETETAALARHRRPTGSIVARGLPASRSIWCMVLGGDGTLLGMAAASRSRPRHPDPRRQLRQPRLPHRDARSTSSTPSLEAGARRHAHIDERASCSAADAPRRGTLRLADRAQRRGVHARRALSRMIELVGVGRRADSSPRVKADGLIVASADRVDRLQPRRRRPDRASRASMRSCSRRSRRTRSPTGRSSSPEPR